MVTPASFSTVGRGPLGREPWASASIMASWAGLGAGNPSGRGNLKGTAETMAEEAMERARMGVERGKCMVMVELACFLFIFLLSLKIGCVW